MKIEWLDRAAVQLIKIDESRFWEQQQAIAPGTLNIAPFKARVFPYGSRSLVPNILDQQKALTLSEYFERMRLDKQKYKNISSISNLESIEGLWQQVPQLLTAVNN
ncbi:Hypothetical_protein [Hexamita inflata]|uniref:Hypothetical_protein n=1 Tax=Hexamita inflata TaxID=28002 RepID=A0AA86UU72_9EUKA|nr:Hypothetical protein HINF_LOCUS52667 [Hexamita inflata]